jgi:integrase
MSLLHSRTTADFLNWNDMIVFVQKLERDNNYSWTLLITTGCYTGLRISDLLNLRWEQLLNKEILIIKEVKTGKLRRIKLNAELLGLVHRLFNKLGIQDANEYLFLNRKTCKVFSRQYINRKLKVFRFKYRLNINNFSTHTLRKTFGRHIWENSGYSEKAITLLSDIFNHSSYRITRRYLGINDDDIDGVYDLL